MIVDTCKEWEQVEGIIPIQSALMIICGTCDKRKKCHAEIQATKAKESK